MANKKRYSDLDLDFLTHPVSGDITFKYDAEAVKRSIRNLIFMGMYEKPFHPEIRSEIRNLLFENFTPIIGFEIEKEIEDILRDHEPRAKVEEVLVVQNDDNNRLDVTLRFRVIGIPDERLELELPLERIR
jgi:phage baseplate assembly protein W